MGYERKRKLYRLDFAGTSLEGLEIDVRGMSFGQALDTAELAGLADIKGIPTEDEKKKIIDVLDFFVTKIERWNVTADGVPIPPSTEEIMTWDIGDVFAMINAWQEAIMAVPAPLERPSSGGRTWQGPPIPMEMSLPNLPNLSVHE